MRFICRSGAGLENIDDDATARRNIRVFNSPEGNRDAVGEHALGMLLSCLHQLREADVSVRRGEWDREGHRGMELAARTVGIVGFGHMGSAFAEKLTGMGCRILAVDPYRTDHDGRPAGPGRSRRPRHPAARSRHRQPALQPDPRDPGDGRCAAGFQDLPNPSCCSTPPEAPFWTAALLDALDDGRVISAGLDVFDRETASFETVDDGDGTWNRLMAHPRTQVSPHVAGWTEESYVKLSSVLADKVLAEFGG